MKKFAIVALAAIFACCIEASLHTSIHTDKDVYHSREPMLITLRIESPSDMQVKIWIYGIKNMRGQYLLNIEREANLSAGVNELNFSYTTPLCSKCAGLPPGEYFINSSVMYGGISSNSSTKIRIEI